MSKPDPPQPPNPIATAAAQTGTNVATGVANAFLSNVNQITPEGALNFDPTGSYNWTDPSTGHSYNIPTFTATQTLSPQQQAIRDQSVAAQYNLAGMANTQSGRVSELLGQTFNTSNAPRQGDYDWISGQPAAQGAFGAAGNVNLQGPQAFDLQEDFGDVGGVTRTYGPADDFSSDRSRVEESLYGRLNPQLAEERRNIEQRLADQGIAYGSPAYTAAMDDYNRQANDARLAVTQTAGAEQQRMMDMAARRAGFQNAAQQQAYEQERGRAAFRNQVFGDVFGQQMQAATFGNAAQQQQFAQEQARGQFYNQAAAQQQAQAQATFNAAQAARNQALQEQYQLRNQPINEITALLRGGQVTPPNFINAPGSQIANTDVAGIINTNFQQQMQNAQMQNQNTQALLGGLFGLGGNIARGVAASDRRVKKDIRRMGTTFAAGEDGERHELPIYEFSYKKDPAHRRHVGPMAQDVEEIDPRAVTTRRGVKHIYPGRVMGDIFAAAA
jgi:Chaperone of endosialidase